MKTPEAQTDNGTDKTTIGTNGAPFPVSAQRAERLAREAEALRANLAKRKAQQRARVASPEAGRPG